MTQHAEVQANAPPDAPRAAVTPAALAMSGADAGVENERGSGRRPRHGWLVVLSEFAFVATLSLLAALLHRELRLGNELLSSAVSTAIAIAGYFSVRRFLRRRVAAERHLMFDQLLLQLQLAVRRIEAEPARAPQLLSTMLREWIRLAVSFGAPTFLPLVGARGGTNAVAPPLAADAEAAVGRIERSMTLDAATERGRVEERVRLAHDLHDDIGSRLLTLIYKAQTPDLERDLRKTLDDLKTLTRGLAVQHHRLADAAAEWRLDLMQRASAAEMVLDWSCRLDDDPVLTVVQWSALTRILRELVSNAIAHAEARALQVRMELEGGCLDLVVADDGRGADPRLWAHGLGLSSVRKRVAQLGGDVAWKRLEPQGILCRVRVTRLTAAV